jgi:hypothetical protein
MIDPDDYCRIFVFHYTKSNILPPFGGETMNSHELHELALNYFFTDKMDPNTIVVRSPGMFVKLCNSWKFSVIV